MFKSGGVATSGVRNAFRTDSCDALRAVLEAAAIISARTDVEVLSRWEVQTGEGPVAGSDRAIAEKSVVQIVGGRLKGNARELRAGAAADLGRGIREYQKPLAMRPGNGGLRHRQVLQRGGVVVQTGEKAAGLSADAGESAAR